jgi:hypothetical protein
MSASNLLLPVNVHVYPGNSGRPVYFQNQDRTYDGVFHGGEIVFGIVGLIGQRAFPPGFSGSTEPLSLAVIVLASFIPETIDLLFQPK